MSFEDSSTSTIESQECILNCKDAKQFYNFPSKTVMRNIWLYKLGLEDDDFYPQPSVCGRHFSEKMFDLNGKLKTIAVPDINLPSELTLRKYSSSTTTKDKGIKANAPILQPSQRTIVKKKPIKSIVIPSLKSNTTFSSSKTNGPQLAVNTSSTQTNVYPPLSTESWINDSSNILVDYQLKVRGKHLCDVIEIPQYVVVFTVIKAKQNNQIKLSDIQNQKKVVTTKKVAIKTHPKPSAYITIDEDIDETSEIIAETEPTVTNPLEIVRLDIQTKPLEIAPPDLPADIPTESIPIVQQKSQPEHDIVYYTTDPEEPPRRDRSVQVDLSNKRLETGIQCDVQLDNDIKEMSYNAELYWLQTCFKRIDPQVDIDECLVCGEILSNSAAKVKHAHGHVKSPTLCSQCGDMFDSQIKLNIHEKTCHLNKWKPHRCPKMNCKKAFRSTIFLNKHIEEVHIRRKQSNQCNKCFQFFSSPMKLICHQRALDKCLRTRGWISRRWSKRI